MSAPPATDPPASRSSDHGGLPPRTEALHLAVDAKLFTRDPTGIGRYALGLIGALATELGDRDRITLLTGPQTRLESLPDDPRIDRVAVPFRSSAMRSWFSLRPAIRRSGANVLHGLDHLGLPARNDALSVVTVHDVLPLSNPEWFSPRHRRVVRWFLPRAVKRAHRIIVPSRHVAAEVKRLLRVPEDRIAVIPEAPAAIFRPGDRREPVPLPLPDSFVLFVGRLEARKNARVLLRALAAIPADRRPQLVLTGLWGPEERQLRRDTGTLEIDGFVQFAGYVSDKTLAELYRRALIVAMPSRAEGFGLPVIEAMASGAPVACSNTTSLPEVAGGAAELFDPDDVQHLAEILRRAADEPPFREDLARRGQARAACFSWAQTARSTIELYRSALAERSSAAERRS